MVRGTCLPTWQLRCVLLFALSGFLAFAACGGGGTSDGSRTQPPPSLAALTVTPAMPWTNGLVELDTQCVGSGTLRFEWDLGDGTRRTTAQPHISYLYLEGGSREVSVTCIDDTQQQVTARRVVVVDPIDLNAVANRTCSSATPGHGWCAQNPLPTGAVLYGLAVIDRATLWAVGAGGSIVKSDDGGATWNAQSSGTSQGLLSIAARDDTSAWAAGAGGTLLRTADGGRTWAAQGIPTTADLQKVVLVGARSLWVVGGGEILKSSDDGASWQHQYSGGSWASISAVNEQVAWVAGDFSIMRTGDGGTTWVTVEAEPKGRWSSVAAISADVAWLLSGSGRVYRTEDGGLHWTLQAALSSFGFASAIVALDANTAWVAGGIIGDGRSDRAGLVMTTRDAGVTWKEVHVTEIPALLSLMAESADRAWAVGPGFVAQTFDSGDNWQLRVSGSTDRLVGVAAVDEQNAWAVEMNAGGILRTTDGGIHWLRQPVGTGILLGVDAVDRDTAWVVGRGGVILKSDSSGAWHAQRSNTTMPLVSVSAANRLVAWVGGSNGTLLLTIDGGASWLSRPVPVTDEVESVSALDASTAWVATLAQYPSDAAPRRGSLRKTTDGGATWVSQLDSSSEVFLKVAAVDASTAWAISRTVTDSPESAHSVVFRTVDGGANWKPVWTLTSDDVATSRAWLGLQSIHAMDGQRAHVVGGEGQLYETKDGGATWARQPTSTAATLWDITWLDDNTAWVVGDGGVILKTLTGGR